MKQQHGINGQLEAFSQALREEEKSRHTLEKYRRDVRQFLLFLRGRPICKEATMAYKQALVERGYALRSVNSMLASVNAYLRFAGLEHCRVRQLKTQQQIYQREDRQLTRGDYLRLVEASREKPRLTLLLQAICATGVRVSEVQFFTVEAVRRGEIVVTCKNKTRNILIPGKLKKKLLSYALQAGIRSGVIFRTRTGRPLGRTTIWQEMKSLCARAGVAASKVFPHNLRKLFARAFYDMEKDIAKLADVLGHSNINTTRIYLMTTGEEHRRKMEKLGLVL